MDMYRQKLTDSFEIDFCLRFEGPCVGSPLCGMPRYRGTSLIRYSPLLGPYRRTSYTQGPMVVLGGGAVSYERGTPEPITRK